MSDKLSSSSVTGPRNRDSYSHGGGEAWPQGSARHEQRGMSEEGVLDRKAALLLYLREVLGRASICNVLSAFYCFPLSHPRICRVGGESGQRGGAEGQKILPVLPRHRVHRCCWSRALPRTYSEGERHQGLSPFIMSPCNHGKTPAISDYTWV